MNSLLRPGVSRCPAGDRPPGLGAPAFRPAPSARGPGAGFPRAARVPAALALLALACVGAPEGEVVRVWYAAGEEPAAVERRVESATPSSALAELVRGPTAAERERGLTSWWSEETAGVVASVTESDGRLVVDFRDLPRLIPNASSSAGSTQLLTSLDSTLFQFEDVEAVEYRLVGSCDAFWNWLQRDCTVIRR